MTAITAEKPLSWADRRHNVLVACLDLDDAMTHDDLFSVRQQIRDAEKPLEELFLYLMETFLPIAFSYQSHIAEKGAPGSEDIEARRKTQRRFEEQIPILKAKFARS